MLECKYVLQVFPEWLTAIIGCCLIMVIIALFFMTIDIIVGWCTDDDK